METDSWDILLEVHPSVLEKLAKMPRSVAKRFLLLSGWFNPLEIEILVEENCHIISEPFGFKVGRYENPFLL